MVGVCLGSLYCVVLYYYVFLYIEYVGGYMSLVFIEEVWIEDVNLRVVRILMVFSIMGVELNK